MTCILNCAGLNKDGLRHKDVASYELTPGRFLESLLVLVYIHSCESQFNSYSASNGIPTLQTTWLIISVTVHTACTCPCNLHFTLYIKRKKKWVSLTIVENGLLRKWTISLNRLYDDIK